MGYPVEYKKRVAERCKKEFESGNVQSLNDFVKNIESFKIDGYDEHGMTYQTLRRYVKNSDEYAHLLLTRKEQSELHSKKMLEPEPEPEGEPEGEPEAEGEPKMELKTRIENLPRNKSNNPNIKKNEPQKKPKQKKRNYTFLYYILGGFTGFIIIYIMYCKYIKKDGEGGKPDDRKSEEEEEKRKPNYQTIDNF